MSSSSPPPRRSPSHPHNGQQWKRGQQVPKFTAPPDAATAAAEQRVTSRPSDRHHHDPQSTPDRAVAGKSTQPQRQRGAATKVAPAAAWGQAQPASSRGYANAPVVPRGLNGEGFSAFPSQQKGIIAGDGGSSGGDATGASKTGSWGGVGRGGASSPARHGEAAARPACRVDGHGDKSPPAPTKAAAGVAWPSLTTASSSRVSPSRSRPQPQPQSQPSRKEPHAQPPSPGGTVPASTARAWETTAPRREQSKPPPPPQQQQQQQQAPAQLRRPEKPSQGGKEAAPGQVQPLQLLSRPQQKSPSQGRPREQLQQQQQQQQQQYQLVKRKSNNKDSATAPAPSAGGNNGKASASSVVPSSKSTSTNKNAAAAGASKKPGQSTQHGNPKKPKPSSNALTLSDLMPAGAKGCGKNARNKGGGKDKKKAQVRQEATVVPVPVPAPVPTEDDFPPMAPPPLRSYPTLAAASTVGTRSSSPKKVRAPGNNDGANKGAAGATEGSKKGGGSGVKRETPNDRRMNRGVADGGRQSAKDRAGEKSTNSASSLSAASVATKKKKKTKKQVPGLDLLGPLPVSPAKMTADEEQMRLMQSMMLGMKRGASAKASGQNDASSPFPAAAATKGKQRLGPRKKRLTTLKKKVLQERLRKWREKEELEQEERGAAVPTPIGSESKVEADSTANDAVQSQSISSAGEKGEYNDKTNGTRTTVYLSNFVEPDELDDDEEYEEIVGDVREMAAKIGPVENVAVPRSKDLREEKKETTVLDDHVGLVVVTFAKELDALAARDCWDGMVIGGAQVHASLSVPGRGEEATEVGTDDVRDSPGKATLVLDNILGDDDFADEDCLEESKGDIMDMCNGYGRIDQFRIELEDDCKGLVYIVYEEGQQVAILAAKDLNGKVIGGQKISARVVQLGSADSSGPAASSGAANEATVEAPVLKSTFIVALENILTEDDLMDEDCLQESKDDILELAREYGHVDEVYIQQDGSAAGGVYVRYHTGQEAAILFVTKLNGMVIGGQTVTAHLLGDIVLGNILTEDDFLDEECLEESKSDIMTLASQYGEVASIQIVKNAYYDDVSHEGLVYVSYREGEKVGNVAMKGLDGMTIGGQRISAWPMRKSAAMTRTSHVTAKLADENDIASVQKHEETKAEAGQESCPDQSDENTPAPMYSGDKIIPERYAACKRVPKVPNAVPNRSYASRVESDEAVPLLNEMLGELMRFQLRAKDDANARARRRLVMGLREVARGLRAHKVKMVIMANNLDEYGVIDNKLEEILDLARDWDVPVLFELNKRKLGKALGKTIKVSVVGIQNADGAHQQFKKLQKLASLPRKAPPGKPGE